ncbi:SigE family RNA polymerase sigma factor [Streptomyces sp. SID13031]|uniref:SigE family RNA polymerase sigma factor n=1 Tax=Streptomyces sp. SID13031 TaxID=2706046 RepID=UPI0013C841C0|nr:SigE family RNA polymerase sigma factor [Streptomyces sp. SID13031]NEA35312.1 SigE family RNA polymerase sigma factor [Streptomyces sp. SID13031]
MAIGREFEEFTISRQRALFRYAYLLIGDRGLAEDLLQESLTKTYVRWNKLRDSANAEAYTRRVMTNTAISWFRRKSWRERPHDTLPAGAPAPAEDTTGRVWLWAELAKLPPQQRAVLVLRYYEDLTQAETARVLGCSEGTVKSQGSRALKKLRAGLGPDALLIVEKMVTA